MTGTTIAGRYRLEQLIGTGGMSEVWRATDLELERVVAVKLLAPEADPGRFEREARAIAALTHPNICALYDYGEAGGRPFMVLEHLPGGSLEERLSAGRPLPDEETLRIAIEIAAGLAHAHNRGVVHRDLKPLNVLFDARGHAKIADFGIARAGAASGTTETGTVLGTAAYISPEQAAGRSATAASDVYAFGVILFRMLTGRLPFESADGLAVAAMHRDDPPPPVPEPPPRRTATARERRGGGPGQEPGRPAARRFGLLAELAPHVRPAEGASPEPALRRRLPATTPSAAATGGGRLARVISVVVPVHNEERSVALLLDELGSALQPLGTPWETIFVDDGSTDGSYAALTRLHAAHENVSVVRLRRNFGKAAALAAGFAAAHGEVIVTIDGDLQDDPAEIPKLLVKLEEGFDLVSGWKTRRRDPLPRRALSRIFNRVSGWISGVRLHDMNCGLKAYRAEVVRGLRLYGELHRFIPVLAHHRGYRIAELPVNHRPRDHGRSRYGLERYLRGFLDLLTVSFIGRYRHRPLHLFGGLGLALSTAGAGILVYLTVVKAIGHAIGGRPLLILGVLLVVVGIQVFSLGLITELITSHHEERTSERERAEALVEEILS